MVWLIFKGDIYIPWTQIRFYEDNKFMYEL